MDATTEIVVVIKVKWSQGRYLLTRRFPYLIPPYGLLLIRSDYQFNLVRPGQIEMGREIVMSLNPSKLCAKLLYEAGGWSAEDAMYAAEIMERDGWKMEEQPK